MKIVYIANARIPTEKANGYQIAKMCEEFAKSGNEVELIVPTRRNIINEDVYTYYGLERNFSIRYIKSIDFFIFKRFLGKLSFYFQHLFFLLRILFIKIDKNSIVYTRSAEAAWLCKFKKRQAVLELHGWPEKKQKLFCYFVSRTKKVVTVTSLIKKLMLEQGLNSASVLVAPDGADQSIFNIALSKKEAREKQNLPQDKIILGYTGSFKTMGRDKGISVIVDSLPLVLKKRKDLLFVAVGGNKKDINYYNQLAKEKGVVEAIELRSRVNIKELAIFQKACDILLMPFPDIRHYALFMSPLKMFEYMFSERPIISSDLPSVRDVLNEKNCMFVKPDDPKDLADKIIGLIGDEKRARAISEQAFRDVEKYAWSERTRRIIEFINT